MPNDKAGQPNRTAPPVTLRNAKSTLQQRTDSTRSQQHVNATQDHLLFGSCDATQRALHAVCSPLTYQGTLLMLIYLAGSINAATGQTFIGSTTLAQRIGVDRDTTDAQLQRLQDAGIVTIQGKQGRSYIRSIMLPCSHLDMYAESSAESSADTHADLYAESCADTHADTSPHYQDITRSGKDQQQVDVVADYSLAERQVTLSAINDGLPKHKQLELNRRLHNLFDSWHDNSMSSGEIIKQLHIEHPTWNHAGGTIVALERITDTWAADYRKRQPLPVLVACKGLAADVECDTMTHTKLGSNDPVQQCPQRKGAS
jgi:hypothetical protein